MEYIKVSEIVRAEGYYPTRVIIWKREPIAPGWGEYVTHIEVMPEGRVPFQVMGHYDMTLKDALEDFNERAERLPTLPRLKPWQRYVFPPRWCPGCHQRRSGVLTQKGMLVCKRWRHILL